MAAGGEASGQFRVVVLSGPSGSGKTTIVRRLLAQSPVKLVKSISATTRPPRPGEVNGVSYYFLTREQFEDRLHRGEFLETAEVFGAGYLYGTLKSEIERARDSGGWAFLEIDVHGALKVMRQYPDAISIFLKTPETAYEQRLRARATETEEMIQRRVRQAQEELRYAPSYQYQVMNDDLDRAVREICEILAAKLSASNGGGAACSTN